MAYRIHLPVFEGPLELLLFLIRKNEIDIYDIPIAKICEEYLGALDIMKDLNLDIAGEFLVMASTLMRIKAQMLLPRLEGAEGPAEDPREELVRSLVEYQRFREAAMALGSRDQLERDVFIRQGGDADEFKDKRAIDTPASSIFDLLLAFRKVLEGLNAEMIHQVVMDRVSILDRINQLIEMFQDGRARPFSELFGGNRERSHLIVTFLAILELARLGMIKAQQPAFGQEIVVWPDKEAMASGEGPGIDIKVIEEYH